MQRQKIFKRKGVGAMGNTIISIFISGFLLAFLPGTAGAQHQHDHGSPSPAVSQKGTSHKSHKADQSAKTTMVEGLRVTFESMDMEQHMKHMPMSKGGAHHSETHMLMVMLQDAASKELISDARVNIMILAPSGDRKTGKMDWSGDHYGMGFTPKEKGDYQVQLVIESGGMEREAKFLYSAK
jgi:hypothetical protein